MLYDEKNTRIEQLRTSDLMVHLERIKSMIKKFDDWYKSLPKDAQERLKRLYTSARGNLDDAKADISAVTSEYLVYVAAQIAKEEQK